MKLELHMLGQNLPDSHRIKRTYLVEIRQTGTGYPAKIRQPGTGYPAKIRQTGTG